MFARRTSVPAPPLTRSPAPPTAPLTTSVPAEVSTVPVPERVTDPAASLLPETFSKVPERLIGSDTVKPVPEIARTAPAATAVPAAGAPRASPFETTSLPAFTAVVPE